LGAAETAWLNKIMQAKQQRNRVIT
jgi:hypothetical protein